MHERVEAMLIGRNVFVLLAGLTAIEYAAAVSLESALVPLLLIALAKALLIVVYFMHIRQLRKDSS